MGIRDRGVVVTQGSGVNDDLNGRRMRQPQWAVQSRAARVWRGEHSALQ